STVNGDETVTFLNNFTVTGTTTLSSHVIIPTGVSTVFAAVVNVGVTSTITKNGTGNVTFSANVNNSGAITHNGTGAVAFSATLTNQTGPNPNGFAGSYTTTDSGSTTIFNLVNTLAAGGFRGEVDNTGD